MQEASVSGVASLVSMGLAPMTATVALVQLSLGAGAGAPSPDEACRRLVVLANPSGGTHNETVVVASFSAPVDAREAAA